LASAVRYFLETLERRFENLGVETLKCENAAALVLEANAAAAAGVRPNFALPHSPMSFKLSSSACSL